MMLDNYIAIMISHYFKISQAALINLGSGVSEWVEKHGLYTRGTQVLGGGLLP